MGHEMKCFLVILILTTSVVQSQTNIKAQSFTADEIFSMVNESVVIVNAYNFYGIKSSQGSGVSIGNGIIVTNYHVFMGNDSLEVEQYGRKIKVKNIVGADIKKDVLILRLDDNSIPGITYNDSISYKIGNKIYAIGSPLGYENSISEGIISGLRTLGDNENYIQISAGIDHGSSGGAVVSERGELIGISTLKDARARSTFINFAIPINYIFSSLSLCEDNDLICEKSLSLFYKAFNALVFYHSKKERVLLDKSLEYISSYIQQNDIDSKVNFYFDLVFQDRPYSNEFIEQYETLTQYFNKDYLKLWQFIKKYCDSAGSYKIASEVMSIIVDEPENPNYYCLLGQIYGDLGNKKIEILYFSKAAELGDVQAISWLKKHGYIK